MSFFSVTKKLLYGKLGVMRVVTSQGSQDPFPLDCFFYKEMLLQLSCHRDLEGRSILVFWDTLVRQSCGLLDKKNHFNHLEFQI